MTIPNLLSLARMGLVPLFIIALVGGEPVKALALFVLAGVTDALDGFIARFFDQKSHLGIYLDPIADKLLLISAYVMLAIHPEGGGLVLPFWISVVVIARDVLIVIVALVLYVALGTASFPPALIGKLTTAVQVITVVLVILARIAEAFVAAAWIAIYLTVALTIASGSYYVYRASRLPEAQTSSPTGP